MFDNIASCCIYYTVYCIEVVKSKIKSLYSTGDTDFAEVIRHSFWAIILLGGVTIIQFVFDLSLTHRFKAHGAGIFYLCFSVLMMLALAGRLGMERTVVRFIPPLLSDKPEGAYGVVRTAVRLSLTLTIPLGILLFVFAPYLAEHAFHSSKLTPYLRIFAFAIPALSLNYVLSGVLRAIRQTQFALSIERMTMYAFGIIAIYTLGAWFGITGLMVGFVAGIYISTLSGFWHIKRHISYKKPVVPFSKKQMLIVSTPLLFFALATQLNGQASVLLLGHFGSNSDVGIFNIALKVSMLMALILTAINVIVGTKVSELYAAKKHEDLSVMVSKVSALGALCGIPLFILLAAFSHIWLGLFGHAFIAGSVALTILAAGQLINVSVGSTGLILAMTGHERALAAAITVALAVNIGLGLVLIPAYGVDGAGITAAATLAIGNIIMVFMVRRYLGIWSLPFKYLRVWAGHFKAQG